MGDVTPKKYVQESCRNAEEYLEKNYNGRKLDKRANAPWIPGYECEVDATPELSPELASYYQSQIGILRWMVELGRVDMITEVSKLASQMVLPREGHLECVFHIFAYLNNKHNSRNVFDPTYPEIEESNFPCHDWKSFYGDVREAIPVDAPTPREKEVITCMFVDSDHAGEKKTRRSRSGFFIFVQSALVAWMSKKQATIETSVFGGCFLFERKIDRWQEVN